MAQIQWLHFTRCYILWCFFLSLETAIGHPFLVDSSKGTLGRNFEKACLDQSSHDPVSQGPHIALLRNCGPSSGIVLEILHHIYMYTPGERAVYLCLGG